MGKKYWSQRKGLNTKFDLSTLKTAFNVIIDDFFSRNYYQEYYGYGCVDAGAVDGKAGSNIPNYIFRKIRKKLDWPINISNLDEDTLFDVIELYHDTISFPEEGYYHSYANCGYHYTSFNSDKGQNEYRNDVNEILADYEDGYLLNNQGEIQLLLTPGLKELTEANIPMNIKEDTKIKNRIEWAIKRFRDRHSTFIDRRESVRELADVLEYLKSTIKQNMLKSDESALFEIANNFSIRHNNSNQKEEYSQIWLSWIFYLYLSTIHLCLRLR
jgi:hypothetical protein